MARRSKHFGVPEEPAWAQNDDDDAIVTPDDGAAGTDGAADDGAAAHDSTGRSSSATDTRSGRGLRRFAGSRRARRRQRVRRRNAADIVHELPDGPILASRAETAVDNVSREERPENKPPVVRAVRRAVTSGFGMWTRISAREARRMNWIPRVEPYIGYGTTDFSRLICRTTYAPQGQDSRPARPGIRQAFMVPAGRVRVTVSIDNVPVLTMQVGSTQVFDPRDESRERSGQSIFSDSQGYLDLLIERRLEPGVHDVEYSVANRRPVHTQLVIIPSETPLGIISDVDDTIMVTDVPRLWSAIFNMLFRDPNRRRAVEGMPAFYQRIRRTLPDAPFFYLSTSPWNVESSIRHLIRANGYPQGPLLLRDFDPRPKTFIPSGVQHKLEFAEQLMSDFPNMRFILLGDDGQSDPTTYAQIAQRYPGRVAAIGIRQVTSRVTAPRRVPDIDVPVFYGPTGSNLMSTMLPYIERLAKESAKERARDGAAGSAAA